MSADTVELPGGDHVVLQPTVPCPTDTTISATKTAVGSSRREITYDWTIEKTANPQILTIGEGETGSVLYTNPVSPLLPISLGTPGGPKTVVVISASQAATLLSNSGNAANGINKLYSQLLGAKLNIESGASSSAASATIGAADAFLATHDAGDWASLSSADKQKVLGWQSKLDDYNNGLTGPGHCN